MTKHLKSYSQLASTHLLFFVYHLDFHGNTRVQQIYLLPVEWLHCSIGIAEVPYGANRQGGENH